MIRKDILKQIIADFHSTPLPRFTPRELTVPIQLEKIISIIGARRAGKTYFLYQLMDQLLQDIPKQHIIYINFEDERLDFTSGELDLVLQAYRELYPEIHLDTVYFFFDEIQNTEGWDRFARRIYDSVSKHIFITGSNSRLLSRELATALRGRTLSYEIFPLSFKEYLTFREIETDTVSSKGIATVLHYFDHYLKFGGFPEIIRFDDALKDKILQDYYNTMLFRDLVERYEIKQVHILKYFLKRLMASVTKNLSVNKIFNELKSQGLKMGKELLYEFLEEIENIYLMFVSKKYAPSVVKQELSDRKIYCLDNGLLNAVTFKFSKDTGKLLENMMAVELRRRKQEVYFLKNHRECDFVLLEKDEAVSAFQVSLSMEDPDTREREINGLLDACKKLNLDTGTIITRDEEDRVEINGVRVDILPAYKFLLSQS